MKRGNIIISILLIVITTSVLLYYQYPKFDESKAYVREYIVGESG